MNNQEHKTVFVKTESAGNLPNFEITFHEVIAGLGVSWDEYVVMMKEDFAKRFPTLPTAVAEKYLMQPINFDGFMEAMRVIGAKVEMRVTLPAKQELCNLDKIPPVNLELEKIQPHATSAEIFSLPVHHLGVPVRVVNILNANDVLYIGQLVAMKASEVRRFHGLGPKGLAWLEDDMELLNLHFETDVGDWQSPDELEAIKTWRDISLKGLGLGTSVVAALAKHGITLVGHVLAMTEEEVTKIKGLTPNWQHQLTEMLGRKGLKFGSIKKSAQ